MELGFGDRNGDMADGEGESGTGDGAGGDGSGGDTGVAMELGMVTRMETGQMEMRMGQLEMGHMRMGYMEMVQAKMVEPGSMQVELEVGDVAGENEARGDGVGVGIVQMGGWGVVQAKMAELGTMLVEMEVGMQQVDMKLGRVQLETVKLEWEGAGGDSEAGLGGREAKLNLETVQVMKVELEQGLGLMELGTANGTTGVKNGEVKLGWLRRAGWSMVELSRGWSSWGWG